MNRFAILVATSLMSLAAHAGTLTMNEVLIKKLIRSPEESDSVLVMGFLSTGAFCLQSGCGLEIEDFSVARYFEDMNLGLYRCKGDFVHLRGRHNIQVFKIQSCTALNEDELRQSCPPKPKE